MKLLPANESRAGVAPRRALACVATLIAGAGSACSDPASNEGSLGYGRHALTTTIFQADGQTSLLGLVEDPGVPGVFDATRALEIGGSAALFGRDGRSVFAIGSSDSANVTRYDLSEGGVEAKGALSLQPYGISSGFKRPELVPFVSDTKAYWIDDGSSQVVVWNPEEMTLSGSFSLAAAEREGWLLEVGEAVVRGSSVFVSANYRDANDGEAGQAVAIVLDTTNDTVAAVLTDDRCGGTLDIAPAEDGMLYFATNSFSASLYALQRPADYPAPCVLRVLPGEEGFDPEFYISTLELTLGRPAGQLVLGARGSAYVLALHDDLLGAPIGPDTDIFAPYEASAWRWWQVELGVAAVGTPLDGLGERSAASRVLRAGGREYIANIDLASGTTTLLAPQPDGSLAAGLQITGYPYGLLALE